MTLPTPNSVILKEEDHLRFSASPGLVYPLWIAPRKQFGVLNGALFPKILEHNPKRHVAWDKFHDGDIQIIVNWVMPNTENRNVELYFVLLASHYHGGVFLAAPDTRPLSIGWDCILRNLLEEDFLEINGLPSDFFDSDSERHEP